MVAAACLVLALGHALVWLRRTPQVGNEEHVKNPDVAFSSRPEVAPLSFWIEDRASSRRLFRAVGSVQALPLGFLLLALAVAGCKSASPTQYISPRYEGRVVDAQTREPIEGAKVHRVVPKAPDVDQAPTGGAALKRTPAVQTGKNGRYVLDSERDLELFRRTGWYAASFAFEKRGYETFTADYTLANATNTPSGEPLIKAGDIPLRRRSSGQ
jgi:hypothetical protein